VALFRGTPTYFGDGDVVRCKNGGLFSWFARLLGFPSTPHYLPPDPDPDPCDETKAVVG
jgi:hypothetical protein